MSFKSLAESQIVANLIDTYSSLATNVDDMNQGSVIRSLFEAFAQEMKRLYQNIQESASEVQKMAAYGMFNFPLLPAQAAYTIATFSVPTAPTSDVSIPAGTTVGVLGTNIQYKTPAVMTWSAGQTVFQARVVCTQLGTVGNRRAGEITQLVTPIAGLTKVTVTNQRDVRTGSDLETDEQRSNRFKDFLNLLHRGDIRSLEVGAKTAKLIDSYGYISEQVAKAKLVEGAGSNTVYIDNGYYSTSTQLIAQAQKIINGYVDPSGNYVIGFKAAGVPATVVGASYQAVSISVKIAPATGYTFNMIQQSVITAIQNLVQSLNIGQPLKISDLNLVIGNTPGVLNFQLVNLSQDITPANGTLLQLGIGQPFVNPM
jgi:uncharacterized phage protein gp47/JayE